MARKDMQFVGAAMHFRRMAQESLITEMINVRRRYNNDADLVIPVPNTSDENASDLPRAMPAIIANAVDNTAMRAASVMPAIFCPALDETLDTGPGSREYARIRRRALAYTWYDSTWSLGVRRAFRHLSGYMTTSLDVFPDEIYQRPCIKVRDPLTSYPEPKAPEDLTPPADIGYIFVKSKTWITKRYPDAERVMGGHRGIGGTSSELWEIVEWIDEEQVMLGLLGPQEEWRSEPKDSSKFWFRLDSWDNKAGRCSSYTPRRITLDRLANQIANQVGNVDLMSKLVELDVRATERSIYPDTYILAKQGQQPELVGGRWFPGYTGKVNIITDADQVGQIRPTPDPHNTQTIDRMERGFNITAGVVPQMSGETAGSLRTGRAMDTILGASIDPRIQEMHEIMQVAMAYCNEIAVETWKGYFGNRKVVGFSGWATDRGMVEFTPNQHLDNTANAVMYPIPGADVQTTTVILGQMYSAEVISLDTLRLLHPYVSDAEGEGTRRLIEDIRKVGIMAFEKRASEGGVTPEQIARLEELLEEGHSWTGAVAALSKEVKDQQAQLAPMPGQEEGAPQYGAAPGAMPGLGNEGEGGQQLPPAVGPPPLSLDNFRQVTRALRAPNAGIGVNAPG